MSDNHEKLRIGRRDLFRAIPLAAGLGTVSAAPAETMIGVRFQPAMTARVGFIGQGGRGSGLLRNFLGVDNMQVNAVCDLVDERAAKAKAVVEKSGQKAPEAYSGSERAFEKLCQREDLDLVVVATPWKWHTPMAVYAMKHGKHVAVEVPAANSIDECWELVSTSEQTRRHCVMLENCCYGYNELMVLNMVRAGLLGELTHGAAAYNHDLRSQLASYRGEGLWRRAERIKRNGNLYPTHGLGPVANYMNINRGDRFATLVSMSSPAKALYEYRDKTLPAGDPMRKETYAGGDQNTSLIQTAKGLIITLEHNVVTPQPYDRINLIAGTKGIFRDYPPRIYIEGVSKKQHEFESIDSYKAQYEHPLWTKMGELARRSGGHGGMDFLECYRLIQRLREGAVPDMDVYDAAAWSAPAGLSEMSVAKGSAPMQFPDFTRGRWQQARSSV
ncbi:MAG: Gfo/Idh/MocA family oxidoreductase [Acidobacteria bacterium]|nr:Gfo/Idh/MocA family oxidoreductase [Acidobacteriota bacterium]